MACSRDWLPVSELRLFGTYYRAGGQRRSDDEGARSKSLCLRHGDPDTAAADSAGV